MRKLRTRRKAEGKPWNPEEAAWEGTRLAALHPSETFSELAERMLEDRTLPAVQRMVDLAYNATSQKLRWKATKVLLDGHWTTAWAERIVINDDGEEEW